MLAGCSMMVVMVIVMVMMAAVEAVTLTPEQLRVASLDSRRLADQLATILDRITGDPGITEEDTEDSDTEDDIDDSDKVENILLQLEINQLEQELSRLAHTTATTTAPSTTTTTTTVTTPSHNSSQSPARGKTASSGKAASPVKLINSAKATMPTKLSRSKLNRKKFRKMLERFYHGNHFKI